MADTNKIINFDLDRRNVLNLMTKQYDTTGARSVTFRLLKDSQIYNLNNKTVVIGGTKADGTTIFNECTKVDANAGIVRFDITTQMQTVAGTLELELIVIQDNVRLSTIPFDVVIIPSATDLGKIQSTDEFGALQNALSKSDSIVQNFNTKMKELGNLKTVLQESENNSEKQETQRKEQEQTRERAEALRVSQEQARVDAESSRVREETNRVNAEKERLTNESTRQTHEEQRIYAEDAREKAEALRKQIFLENEGNRSSEETQRSVAESTRNANEETRKEQEKDREKAETLRQTAEAERIKAENTRNQNETHREQHYNDFNDAEKTRVSNESSRQNAEELRVHNEEQRNVSEQARINAEKTRLANETTRSTKEDARNKAEQTRNSSEATRVQAENARTNAEQTRISNETSRLNAEEDRVSKENARVSAESTRVSQESARVQAESQRTTDFNKAQTDRQNTFTTNEQARVDTFNTNEATREANEKAREDFINNTAKPVVAKLTDFDTKLSNDIQKVYKTINDGSFIPFTGTDETIDNSKEGYTSNMVIKGQTYQNLFDVKNITGNWSFPLTIKADGTSHSFAYSMPLAKPSNTYTIIIDVSNNTLSNNFTVTGWGSTSNQPKVVGTGILKYTLTTKSNDTFSTNWNMELWKENTQGSITINSLIILEGDWTNKEVPSSITGIESVGDKENNKISILSHNKNLFNFNDLKQYKNISNGIIQDTVADNSYIITIPVNEGNYIYSVTKKGDEGLPYNGSEVFIYNKDGSYSRRYGWLATPDKPIIPINEGEGYISISYHMDINTGTSLESLKTAQLEKGTTATDFIKPKQDKKEILIGLDGGLKSLPDGTCDTIEQREDGVYLVQKVSKIVLDGTQPISKPNDDINHLNTIEFSVTNPNKNNAFNTIGFSDKFNYKFANEDNEHYYTSGGFVFFINKSKLATQDIEGFRQWLQANPVEVYYELATPIETKLDLDTLNLETFKDLTYVTSENNIEPVFNFKAPVDTAKTIADLKVANTKLLADNKQLEEVNTLQNQKIADLNNTTNLLLVSSLS